MQETRRYLALENSHGTNSSWVEIFQSTHLKRTLISTVIGAGVAVTGSKFFSTYASIFLAGVGIKNPYHITLSFASCICVGGFLSPWLLEYVGRRLSLLVGYACLAMCMIIVAAIGTSLGQQNLSVQIQHHLHKDIGTFIGVYLKVFHVSHGEQLRDRSFQNCEQTLHRFVL